MLALIRFPYLMSFLICTLSLLGIFFGQNYWAVLIILALHPLIDTWIGSKKPNTPTTNPVYFDRFLLVTVFAIYAIWFFCLYFF